MTKTIIEEFIEAGFSPASQLNAVHNRLAAALNGEIDIVDTTSPFACSLDMGACLASASIINQDALLRKQYKVLSSSYEDLYLHMADEDYIGRFSNYSSAKFHYYLLKDELEAKAVAVGDTGVRKLVIPKHTSIKVNATVFTLLYPIEIRIMPHGGLQIVYDNGVSSPIGPLETNFIDWKIVEVNGFKLVWLEFNLPQLLRKAYTDTLNPSTGFRKSYQFHDQFYYCRVFGLKGDGTKIEYAVSHSDIVHDVNVPTAVLTVAGDKVTVDIPHIYFSRDMLPGEVEVVIYTTKGDIFMDFSNVDGNSFSLEYGSDFNVAEDSKFSAPLSTLTAMAVGSSDKTTGGSNEMNLERLRDNMIDSATRIQLPITESQLRAKLRLGEYDLINSVDNIMRRIYLATRNLPANQDSGFAAGAAACVGTLLTTIQELAGLGTVIDNGPRVTMTPETIYRYNDQGILEYVPAAMLPNPDNPDNLVSQVNRNSYMFSPFHYVIDTTEKQLRARPYYLESAKVTNRTFIMENETAQLEVSTGGFSLEKRDDGYYLLVTSVCGKTYLELSPDDLFVQMLFIPNKEVGHAYMNGRMAGLTQSGNYIWEFYLGTTFDIDEKHNIVFDNFRMSASEYRNFSSSLTQEFEIIYGVHNYSIYGLKKTDIDSKLGRFLLNDSPLGLTNESVTLNFGQALTNLWAGTRSVPGSVRYKIHEVDVPLVWEENQYVTNPDGTIKVELIDGQAKATITHLKGDPILDAEGEPLFKHKAGDVWLDEDGNKVVITDRNTEQLLDLLLVDGNYAFATHPRDTKYRGTIADTIAKFAVEDMEAFKPNLHEKTELYFHPKKTLGEVKVIVDDGKIVEIPAALEFSVRYYMENSKYKDTVLREAIIKKTSEVINASLTSSTVSRDGIQKALKDAIGNDIVAVDMDNLGEDRDIPVYTSVDDANRCAVRRKLKVLPDNSIIVEEAITIDWLPHKA